MKKHSLSCLLLSFLLLFSLSACSNENNSADKSLPTEISQADWEKSKQYAELSTGIKMAYIEMGQKDGDPVILLHGHTDSSRTWAITAKALSEKFHLYIPDQRGSGNTDAPDNRAYTGTMFANDISAFMESVGLENAHIVGHSMGSANAQYFAALFPEKVDRLILIGSMYVDGDGSYLSSRDMALSEDFDQTDPVFLDNWDYVTPGILAGETYEAEVEEMMEYIKKDTSEISLYAFTNPPQGSAMTSMENMYSELQMPTLLICGESDLPRQEALWKALPHCDGIIVYPGHNHSLQWESPYELADDIAKYLNSDANERIVSQNIQTLFVEAS